MHLPMRHDASPGLHRKAQTPKPRVPATDFVLRPFFDIYGESQDTVIQVERLQSIDSVLSKPEMSVNCLD